MSKFFACMRLAAAFVLMAMEVLVAAPVFLLLLPSRRQRVRLSSHLAHLLAVTLLPILGIRVRLRGGRVMSDLYPALYVSNHSSYLDFFILLKFAPIGTCAIAKKEMVYLPFIGQIFALAGHPTVDRSNPQKARASLNAVARFVREQDFSLWIAPEGVRSLDGRLGPFKKGFVHAAISTGLPVVPVLLWGPHERWPRGDWCVTPGEVRIEVLDAIPTGDWNEERVDEHVQEVRALIAKALDAGERPAQERMN